jgi:uncharacterized membrane protein YccC
MLKREPEKEKRLAGALVALVAVMALGVGVGLLLEATVVDRHTQKYLGGLLTYTAPGLVFIGWRWPDTVLRPLVTLWRILKR